MACLAILRGALKLLLTGEDFWQLCIQTKLVKYHRVQSDRRYSVLGVQRSIFGGI